MAKERSKLSKITLVILGMYTYFLTQTPLVRSQMQPVGAMPRGLAKVPSVCILGGVFGGKDICFSPLHSSSESSEALSWTFPYELMVGKGFEGIGLNFLCSDLVAETNLLLK